ncbi:unnamed protein product [Rotaria socialis]|uniref:Uncharacterized protein n=2 Tax=Rotaria socialis TaxID=392032 RepID=A0A818SS87_9BILA|nr:unnamed protein product [Rotaria socialis]
MQIKSTSPHINNDDDIVLQIMEIEARDNVHLCILLRKPNEQEIKKHVIDAYRNIKNQLEQTFHQSSNEVEQTENQRIETQNVAIRKTTASTNAHVNNDQDMNNSKSPVKEIHPHRQMDNEGIF